MANPSLSPSIIDAIGNTPLVELKRAVRILGLQGRLLAKLEYFSPGFSKKDRVALEMIREARRDGSLRPGQTVVELTSGNTGTGLAIVCRSLGHPLVAVMSRGNTPERARMMRALGAEVMLVDQAPGSPPNQVSGEDLALVEQKTGQVVRERQAFRANQFELAANALAHERFTGPELWKQSGGCVDVFLDFVGSGGCFSGVTRYLRGRNPEIRAYIVEPAGAAVLAGKPVQRSNHQLQGGGYSLPDLTLVDRSLVSGYLQVTDDEAIAAARLLAAEEGIFGGFSSGANLAGAIQLLRKGEQGATIAFLVCDSGLKYLSTPLYPDLETLDNPLTSETSRR
jgi:cysteine synthase A